MATETFPRFVVNHAFGGGPWFVPGKFAAGSSQAITIGEILELTGNTNTEFVPIDSDYDMSSNGGDLALACTEIESGDPAGFYPVVAPRPGDLFEYDLAAAGANALGTSLYYSSSEALTITAGTNVIAKVAGWANHSGIYPQYRQETGWPAKGSTPTSVSKAHVAFVGNMSYANRLAPLS